MLLAHISDTHVDGDPRSIERVRAVLGHLYTLKRPLDAILLTGDIADHGEAAEYEIIADLLRNSPFPVIHLPGNHDRREGYRKVLGGPEGFLNTDHEVAGHRILALDSLIEGVDEGELSASTLEWLGARLAERPEVPTLVAFHHPPVRMHQTRVDQWMLQNGEELAAVLSGHDQVLAVLTGHTHTAAASTFAGRPLLIAPGVVSTLRLDWEPGESITTLDAPPGIAYHVVEDGRVMTHWRTV
ncbi:3',5'-cyclic adenosine monophosphate phosphodiesterase CpdA [Actinorhabdospora filicis]|uniref:3',5'-cyclic adenosine monophosphate phosphodiesterase CpdA n=1 Tax=Actinorhabdospora filicis TaxID=1785913 RepID=A0A9W6W5E2_9ACTN|nr:metallophosphoesterase [Actinorhabdospora filicis]GLZ80287.1 3',5'-cyclic adenosine monophosphate phosphodiesterase CpdA [Actinorhabdospora filicis]